MSEIAGHTRLRGGATAVVHESYSFACMRCGHAWEQSFEIEHHVDAGGRAFVRYVADGRIVPSPLSRPGCRNCDGHLVRIMRAGQVSSALSAARTRPHRPAEPAGPAEARGSEEVGGSAGAGGSEEAGGSAEAAEPAQVPVPVPVPAVAREHHWHLSDLLHVFQRRAS
ncbi:hypothetical protein ACWC10_02735 [Streptomyces sp. NPDC001595]|uniref:hypothetical protein n=1 Tax=Streptomyces sp. NPDC001532 TaxID=3154520 RepID=UPI003326B346